MRSMLAVLMILGSMLLGCAAFATDDVDVDRDPSSLVLPSNAAKRIYPGGQDEEDLKVMAALPEAAVKTYPRDIQKDVYKSLYNQELKDESHAPPVEE